MSWIRHELPLMSVSGKTALEISHIITQLSSMCSEHCFKHKHQVFPARRLSSVQTSVRRSYLIWSTNSTQTTVWMACWFNSHCQVQRMENALLSYFIILAVLILTILFFIIPDHIDERTICNAVSPTKDVDGFHVVNVGRMCLDQSTMLPATPWGVWEIIKRTGNRKDK